MAPRVASSDKRPRLSIDVPSAVHEQVRRAAAKRALSVRAYVLQALAERLHQDLGDTAQETLALKAQKDPVLDMLWDNPQDAAYDRL